MGQPIIHTEIYARQHAKLAEWYKEMFGWETRNFPEMNYSTAAWSSEPGNGVGFNDAANEMPEGQIIPYIYSADIEADTAKLAANGATTSEIMTIPTVGKMMHFRDPDGNLLALMQPDMPG